MGLIESEGLILRTHKLAEADKIVVCLTRKCGVIRGVARGARRLKSRFGASLEPFTFVHLSLFEREGRELMSLRQAEIQQSYFHLAGNTQVMASLEYLSELIIEFAPPHEPDTKLLRMARACLDAISAEPMLLPNVICYFEFWVLKLSGVLSPPDRCAVCGINFAAAKDDVRVCVSRDGAFKCHRCHGYDSLMLSRKALGRLVAMQVMAPAVWARVDGSHTLSDTNLELSKILKRNIADALDRTPRGQTGPFAHLHLTA